MSYHIKLKGIKTNATAQEKTVEIAGTSLRPSIHLSVCLFIYVFIYMSICL